MSLRSARCNDEENYEFGIRAVLSDVFGPQLDGFQLRISLKKKIDLHAGITLNFYLLISSVLSV